MLKKLPVPIGRTDYKKVCRNNYYVDKTLLVKDILDAETDIILFTRPRRFGKTLNMDMLRTFFEKTEADTSEYFIDKKIWMQGEEYTKHQGQYPVIFLSLKDIKSSKWETSFALLKRIIRTEYARHQELEKSTALSRADIDIYQSIIDNTADDAAYMLSLQDLSRMLHLHYKKAPVIIIDEYDTPIQEGYVNGYYAQAVEFIRNFFSAALKDNPHMSLSILTGILRIAKESIFSGLNNIRIYSVLDRKFSSYFGFTAEEVQAMAVYYGAGEKLEELQAWYDGYRFGDSEIFNPWSVLNYFSNDCQAMPFWVQTSANAVIAEILKNSNKTTSASLRALLNGEVVSSTIETTTIYPRLRDSQTNIFGFLLMTGYLKSTETKLNDEGVYVCKLSIPNKEIKSVYRKEIMSLLTDAVGEDVVHSLRQALLYKDIVELQKCLRQFLLHTISCYDGLQENYYHGLLLGMTVIFSNDYYPLSNRESGEGRFDIQLTPRDASLPGIIIEIKAARNASVEKLQELAKAALEQIEAKHYDAELQRQGIATIYKYGIAFSGKNVEICST